MAANQIFRIAVIRGDGIGVDVTDAAIAVMEAARRRVGGFTLDYEDLVAGAGYYRETGRPALADAAQAIELAVESGFAARRLRPMEIGGDQGTRAATAELVALIDETATAGAA